MFVHLRVDESLLHCLPAKEASGEMLAYRACVAFEQMGHIDSSLFALMIEERPHREADIRQVEAVFSSAPVRTQANDETDVRNLEKTLDLLDRCREEILAGERSERAWRCLAMLLMGVTVYLIWKNYLSNQSPTNIASDLEVQEQLLEEAQVASAYGWAYLDVISHTLDR